jgi:glyoxylase-like metal-dependent hydrolase (beta-lactamase superfamily II)
MLVERGIPRSFSGDTLLEKITPNPVVDVNLPIEQRPYDSILDTLLRYNVARIYPGHGIVFGHSSQRMQRSRNTLPAAVEPGWGVWQKVPTMPALRVH